MDFLRMFATSQLQRVQSAPASYAPQAATLGMPSLGSLGGLGTLGGLAGLAGLGMAAFGGGGITPILRVAAPVAGGVLGWTVGADLLRKTSVGQAAVGWLSNTPVGGFLGRDPFRPVGGVLGALTGYALGKIVF